MIVDSGDHASILDGVLLSRAKLRPFRHNRLDKLERTLQRAAAATAAACWWSSTASSRWRATSRRWSTSAELCARHGARLMVDEAHGAGVLGARGAGTAELLGVEDRVDLRMGTFSKSLAACGGFVAGPAEVIDYLRISSRAFLFTASAVPAALGAALAALRIVRSDEGPPLLARVLEQRAPTARRAWRRSASRSRSARRCPVRPSGRPARGRAGAQTIVTPIVPVLVGDDWKAALLWRALYDGGVFTNCALHPAVPPGGALLRTSVMATHDRADARPGARGLRAGQASSSRPSTARFRAPATSADAGSPPRELPHGDLSISSQVAGARKKVASSVRTAVALLTAAPALS